MPTHIRVNGEAKVRKNAIILLEQIRVLDKRRLVSYLGKLKYKTLKSVNKGIIHTFGLDERRN